MKVKVKMDEIEFQDVLKVSGDFVEKDEFDDVFENSKEIFKFFEDAIILGAIIDDDKRVYFITVDLVPDTELTELTIWVAKIE
jgi:hypothetical protein